MIDPYFPWSRRSLILASSVLLFTKPVEAAAKVLSILPRSRVILDNDFGGDPDGLFQLAHQILSPAAEVRAIIGSHLQPGSRWDPEPGQASRAAGKAGELLALMHLPSRIPVFAGAETPIGSRTTPPARTAAVDAIIAEALRSDTTLPLYYAAGAGLTDLASAFLIEPRIADRLKLVWIGGPEYPDLARPPPGPAVEMEFNLSIDLKAAQVIFEQSGIDIWQVPRPTYRQMMFSYSELVDRVRPIGRVGDYLVAQIEAVMERSQRQNPPGVGETYILGDSPLVTLTALQSSFQPDAASSAYVVRPTPRIDEAGRYVERPDGRPIRVYTRIDTRLTFEDMIAKLSLAAPQP